MQRSYGCLLGFLCLILLSNDLLSQAEIRREDHFLRRRMMSRIDLNEKINRPLIQRSAPMYGGTDQAAGEGIVAALLQGLESGTFTAWQADDLNQPMSFEEVLARMQAFEEAVLGAEEGPWEDEMLTDDTLWEEVDSRGEVVTMPVIQNTLSDMDLGPYEQAIQFVEDRIFDKNRGEMVYHIDHFQLIWSDPGESLPDKVLAVFKYKEVAPLLDEVYCHNPRFNDAEARTMKETFELRRFNSYLINISGYGIQSLPESDRRREDWVRTEHELWEY